MIPQILTVVIIYLFWIFERFILNCLLFCYYMSEAFVIFTILCFINSVSVVIMPTHPTTTKLSGLRVARERPQLSDVPPVIYYMETNIQWKKYLANHSFCPQSSSSSGFLCSALIAENNGQYIIYPIVCWNETGKGILNKGYQKRRIHSEFDAFFKGLELTSSPVVGGHITNNIPQIVEPVKYLHFLVQEYGIALNLLLQWCLVKSNINPLLNIC